MKKRLILTISLFLVSLTLVGCNSNQTSNNSAKAENSSLRAENASLKSKESNKTRKEKYSNEDYALMAYLKLQGQTPDELNSNKSNMNWKQNGNKFTIDFGAHSTMMMVTDKQVQVTYDKTTNNGMGQGNGHKVYSKQELADEFGNQKNTLKALKEIINTAKENDNNSTSNNSSTTPSVNNQTTTQSNQNSNTITNSTSSSNTNNTNEEKPLVKNGYTYRPKYNENGQVDAWMVTGPDGRTFGGGDPSPAWQEIESEYNSLNNK